MPVSLGANPINNHEGRMTAAGVFTIPRIAEGSYELSLVGLPGDAVVADVRQNSQSVGNNTILVGSRAPDDLEIIIVRGGTLEGAIRKDGKPVPQGRGYLLAASDFGSRTFIADNAGNFVLRGLVPGPYQFFSLESRVDNPRLGDPLLRSRYAPLAMTVLVAAGDTLTVESTPIPAMDN
jgi:hypothetical protein